MFAVLAASVLTVASAITNGSSRPYTRSNCVQSKGLTRFYITMVLPS